MYSDRIVYINSEIIVHIQFAKYTQTFLTYLEIELHKQKKCDENIDYKQEKKLNMSMETLIFQKF